MSYLYGDSTASQLKSNFLEFLRDAIDFSVFVLQADARMKAGRVQIRVLGEESDAESARLERFITSVSRAVHNGEKGAADSPTAQCATRLAGLIVEAHRTSIDGIRRTLADHIARIEAEEAAGREACVKALGALIAPHEPPDASSTLRLGLGDAGRYNALSTGSSHPALEWTLEIGIPDGHPWSAPMRVDRLFPHLEIRAPQLSGWISKEVKTRPQRIERMVVTDLVDDGETLTFQLRTEPASQIGFDFEVDVVDGKVVKSVRIGPAEDESVGKFDIQNEDVLPIVELAKKLRETLAGLERRPNISATFDRADFRTLPTYVDFIERLVGMMAPIVREISARSLTPNELVLRRALSNDRREEIFVAKATLREKLAVLPDETRALFDPLNLDPQKTSSRGRVAANAAPSKAAESDHPPIRSELPPSVPPPPVVIAPAPPLPKPHLPPPPPHMIPQPSASPSPPSSASAPNATAPVTMFIPIKSNPPPSSTSTIQPPQGVAPPPPGSTTTPRTGTSDAPSIEVVEEVEMSSEALLEEIPESSRELVTKSDGSQRNEALVAALKKIMMLSKNGRAADAYTEYENLFASAAFATYRADEQRQALKLMVLAKTTPPEIEEVRGAHRAARARLQALVDASKAPEDQELLGVTQLYFGDEEAARKLFQAALDTERIRNPQSELIATLMRRISQI